MAIPTPEITEVTRPFWEALGEGRLMFQRCECGHAWLPARSECPQCLGNQVHWEQAGGGGKLVSWVVYHIAYSDAFKDRLPYNVAVVELDEGPRLITNMVDANAALRCDASVRLAIETVDGVALARFALA
jgi:uncharacterized OB-fold protein